MLKHLHALSVAKQIGFVAFASAVWLVVTSAAWCAESTDIKVGREGPNVEAIRRALDSTTELEFVETPLTDVVDFLKQRHGIEIQIDLKALNDANVALDTPITKNLKGVTLRSALKLMLRDLDLRCLIHDEVVLLTTTNVANGSLETRVYLVRDLLPKAIQADGGKVDDYQSLIEAISVADPNADANWSKLGAVQAVPSVAAIVVTQNQETQEKVQDLLAALRKAREQFKQ